MKIIKPLLYSFLILLILPCLFESGCGRISLSGDALETENESEELATCGNSIREPGEECDGETETCENGSNCSGMKFCTESCTWSECIESMFGVIHEVAANDDLQLAIICSGNNLLWVADRLALFANCSFEDRENIFLTLMDENAARASPSLDLFDDGRYWYQFQATEIPGDFPLAVFVNQQEINPVTDNIPVINYFDLEGGHAFELPGIVLGETVPWDVSVASKGDRVAAAWEWEFSNSGHQYFYVMFDLLDTSGSILNTNEIHVAEDSYFSPASLQVVSNSSGWSIFWTQDENPGAGPRVLTLHAVSFNDAGEIVSDPMRLFEDERVGPDFSVAWTISSYALAYITYFTFEDPIIMSMKLVLLDERMQVIAEPIEIGRGSGGWEGGRWLTWTGSELGLAYADLLADDAYDTKLTFRRFDPGLNAVGEALNIYSDEWEEIGRSFVGSIDSTWTGSQYAVAWTEPYGWGPAEHQFSHMAILGCVPP